MIVLDEDRPDVKAALPLPQLQQPRNGVAESSQLVTGNGLPPAYSSTAYNAPLQYPQDVPVHPRERFPRSENARRRFVKAFAVAICMWVLVMILIQSFADFDVDLVVKRKESGHRKIGDKNTKPGSDKSDGKHSDGRVRTASCILPAHENPTNDDSFPDAPYSIKLGFSLPVASDFSFFDNDSYSLGSFVVDAVESTSSDVEVDVVVSYRTPKALRHSKVCLFEKGTERTIGIMSTDYDTDPPSSANVLLYNIFVRLPIPPPEKRPLHISQLVADFTLFGIGMTNLSGLVEFGKVRLTTAYKPIDAESLTARTARLETSQAVIRGNYTTSSSLELLTENAPIQADILMLSADSSASNHSPTKLIMQTTNAPIMARLSLSNPSTITSATTSHSSASDSVGGNFSISSATSYAPLSLSLLRQPFSSFLALSAYTSSSSAEVSLPPQFSGEFRVATSVLRPALDVFTLFPPNEDPAHAERWREVEVTRDEKHLLAGEVIWIDKRGRMKHGGGKVDVETSVLPAILRL